MDKLLVNNHIIKVSGVRKKIIYHFSDTHLSLQDELSEKVDALKAESLAKEWEESRIQFAISHNEPFGELQSKSPDEHFKNIMEEVKDADAVIAAGDLMEYVNGANLRFMEKELKKLQPPFVAVCGNHEDPDDIPDGFIMSRIKNSIQVLHLDDMTILAIDNSKREISALQLEKLSELLYEDKPILILMHVPIMTEENREILMECGAYFQLNYSGADEKNLQFIDLIKKNPEKIIVVCAGHLHFKNESEIVPGVMQYVSSQGIAGNINRYEIGE